MFCSAFGQCGGCSKFLDYDFQQKILELKTQFSIQDSLFYAFSSPDSGFRARADFRFSHLYGMLSFATNSLGKNERVKIESCPILLDCIQRLMHEFLYALNALSPLHILRDKLYGASFLANTNEILLTLIYHKKLGDSWVKAAKDLQSSLQEKTFIIGRSRGQKIVLEKDYLLDNFSSYLESKFQTKPTTSSYISTPFNLDSLKENLAEFHSKQCTLYKKESLFSQPNPYINAQMIAFLLTQIPRIFPVCKQYDLLELYCGSGNFTLPLSQIFRKVFATEVVKDSISLLKYSIKLHKITNIHIGRLNAKECISALKNERIFKRLQDIDLQDFCFKAVLVDPPRMGIGSKDMLTFLSQFPYIIYVSCNPQTLESDMAFLSRTHKITTFALFDQFPYTPHKECIAILRFH